MIQSYLHSPSSVALSSDTIGAALDRAAGEHHDRCALISRHQVRRLTYGELLVQAEAIARGLIALGVQQGDRVGIWSANCVEWPIAQYAVAKAGGILVNLNPSYTVRELEHALNRAGVSVLIAAQSSRDRDYVSILADLVPELTSARRTTARRAPELRHIVYLGSEAPPGGLAWLELAALGDDTPESALRDRERTIQFDRPAMILHTSGTTGLPKGATLSHQTIVNTGFFTGERLGLTPSDRICLPVPLYHIFGNVLGNIAAMTHGCAVVLPSETFDPDTALQAIEEERCTAVYGVPTMFSAQLSAAARHPYRLDSLRTGMMAGAPCSVDVMQRVMGPMHVPEVTISYGMTETSAICQSAVDDPPEDRVSTVGSVMPHTECKIIDPDSGGVVPRGTPGELCARGYSVMIGYWNDAEATTAMIDERRWLHTGDLAVMRDDGRIQIVGRLKELVIRGGEKIHPGELEEVLRAHPKVADAYVVGVPHASYGEELCACVRLRDGESATAEELRGYCHTRVSTHKVPAHVQFVTAFPTTVTGKVQKFRLRETMVAELST